MSTVCRTIFVELFGKEVTVKVLLEIKAAIIAKDLNPAVIERQIMLNLFEKPLNYAKEHKSVHSVTSSMGKGYKIHVDRVIWNPDKGADETKTYH